MHRHRKKDIWNMSTELNSTDDETSDKVYTVFTECHGKTSVGPLMTSQMSANVPRTSSHFIDTSVKLSGGRHVRDSEKHQASTSTLTPPSRDTTRCLYRCEQGRLVKPTNSDNQSVVGRTRCQALLSALQHHPNLFFQGNNIAQGQPIQHCEHHILSKPEGLMVQSKFV